MKAMVEQFKVNNKVYLNIQIIAEEKVKAFLWENNAMSLLEFALAAVAEALSQDPQRQLLVEKIPPIENYNFDSFNARQTSSPYTYDYNYPHFAREKVLELSTNYYNRLVKGLTDSSISTLSAESGIPEKYNGDIAP